VVLEVGPLLGYRRVEIQLEAVLRQVKVKVVVESSRWGPIKGGGEL
jgi:hypothetical protein